MDDTVSARKRRMKPGRAAFALLAALALPVGAQAPLTDPTRPPAEAMLPLGALPVASGPHKPQLQSVLVGKEGMHRAVAVIDGQIVRRGEKVDGAVLESLTATEAVLRRGNKKEVLRVFPLPAAPAKAAKN
ncbi:MSHA biogenesis protein MshK [Massilia sp. YIM B04103]|uniref:MSHA biogenesis protein MshK n=1 Tax=Massilia sp. YIM B04103 TaxID=2963106 RepID=UPI00210C0CED|nr:MSHA biogenesis protein MshK [Massilia sp. YIM B04103]